MIKLESIECLLFSQFSVLCGLLENSQFCWMKYLVIMKILYMSYMHPQFSEARNLACEDRYHFHVSVALTAAIINLPVTVLWYLTIYVPLAWLPTEVWLSYCFIFPMVLSGKDMLNLLSVYLIWVEFREMYLALNPSSSIMVPGVFRMCFRTVPSPRSGSKNSSS